jgi:membrane protein DedA with SNARE-associated domain
MNLVTFTLAALAGRALIFMVVGVLFQVFGAPIKRIIDRYLGLLTSAFVVLIVAGFVVFTQLAGGGREDTGEGHVCDSAPAIEAVAN